MIQEEHPGLPQDPVQHHPARRHLAPGTSTAHCIFRLLTALLPLLLKASDRTGGRRGLSSPLESLAVLSIFLKQSQAATAIRELLRLGERQIRLVSLLRLLQLCPEDDTQSPPSLCQALCSLSDGSTVLVAAWPGVILLLSSPISYATLIELYPFSVPMY